MDWNGAEFDWDSVTRDWNPAMTDVVTNKRTKWNTPKKYNRTIYLMVFLLVILVGNALFPMSFLRRICPTSPTTVNLASFEEGATVIPSLTHPHPYQRTWTNAVLWPRYQSPTVVLKRDSTQCWKLPSGHGSIGISLSSRGVVRMIGISYPAKAPRSNAPRKVKVWAVHETNVQRHGSHSFGSQTTTLYVLGTFIYNSTSESPDQNFTVPPSPPISDIVVEFMDNWGVGTFTCVYGLRAYGYFA
ncbi:hypothetical protein FRB91_002015 [Serendipita sp. 411]|nr:hypothetical protein FRB91_002015 [Serendipita sp. 411]KAG9055934.1 hypothetical protein FS842_000755 [Serendipita sp. 407]